MTNDLLMIVRQIMDQTELPQETFIEAIEAALYSAAKRRYGSTHGVSIKIDPELREIECYVPKKVVEIMKNFAKEIPIEEAVKLKPDAQLDDMLEVEVDPKEFGRIEAQTARQILVQKIKEAERQQIYEEYKDREGEVVAGHVQRMERGSLILDLERTEGVLPFSEMPHPNNFQRNDVLKCLILEVQDSVKGPQVVLSRTHKTLVARLFEMEVPEMYDGLVLVKAIERDPGDRAKVAVTATVGDIDAVGTCVGVKGSRVQTVVRELDGERIDLLEWDENPKVFIANALQPAKVTRVTSGEDGNAEVIVPDDQLSLAIGRRGQNARLAARLTGWKIDIKSESEAGLQFKEEIVGELFGTEPEATSADTELDLAELDGVGAKIATVLKDSAFPTVELVAKASLEELSSIPGVGVKTAEKIQRSALELIGP